MLGPTTVAVRMNGRQTRVATGAGLGLGAALGMGATADASTYTVADLGDSGPFTLRQAIADANATPGVADVIVFHSTLTGTITLASQLTVTDDLAIAGPGADTIAISGNDSTRIIDIPSYDPLRISDLRLVDGSSAGDGGAIRTDGPTLTITDSELVSNEASGNGGAISGPAGTITIKDSTLSGNTAGGHGGAVYNGYITNTVVQNSTLSGNSAVLNGGAMVLYSPPDNYGGCYLASASLHNSTVTENSAALGGGFGRRDPPSDCGSTVAVRNSIVANNTAPDSPDLGAGANAQFSLIESAGAWTDGGNNIVGQDPLLGALADNGGPTRTHRPGPSSPAIDKGRTEGAGVTADQRGFTRPFDVPSIANALGPGADAADMGAVELTLAEATPPVTTPPPQTPSTAPVAPPPAEKKCKKGQKLKQGKCVKKKRKKK